MIKFNKEDKTKMIINYVDHVKNVDWKSPLVYKVPINCEYWIMVKDLTDQASDVTKHTQVIFNDRREHFYCMKCEKRFSLKSTDLTKQVIAFVVSKRYFSIRLKPRLGIMG